MLLIITGLFFYKISWGWFFIQLFHRKNETSAREVQFYLTFQSVFTVLALIATLNLQSHAIKQPLVFAVLATLMGGVAYTFITHPTIRAGLITMAVLSPLALAQVLGIGGLLSFLVGASILGGTLVSLFLGRWYISAATAHAEQLRNSLRIVSIFIGIKFGEFLIHTSIECAKFFSNSWNVININFTQLLFSETAWLYTVRIFLGILVPSLFYVLIFDRLRYRNTQAAMRILYALSTFVLIGELSSLFLSLKLGVTL